jgi:hypothetical protein
MILIRLTMPGTLNVAHSPAESIEDLLDKLTPLLDHIGTFVAINIYALFGLLALIFKLESEPSLCS